MGEVNLACRPLGELAALLPGEQAARLEASVAAAAAALAGRAVWNVSVRAAGGGVAEMLYTVLGYMRAAGVDARWFVLDGDEEFLAVTRRLHHAVRGLDDRAGLPGRPAEGLRRRSGERRETTRPIPRNGPP